MKLSLGFSPCPNDTFIFDALVNQGIDTGDIQFESHLEDVQTLNEWALAGKLDITKISFGVWPLIKDKYKLLSAGGAMGFGVGPLLVSKPGKDFLDPSALIAIPGKNTTANLLFNFAYPSHKHTRYVVFSEVESAVLDGEVDAGVIIHENRFTYEKKGLISLMDLGKNWEQKTGSPIPLGGIVIKKELYDDLSPRITKWICSSLALSWASFPELSPYVKQHAQEMEEEVMRQHIQLYVNDFTKEIGETGMKGIETLLRIYKEIHGE
jgi:1,4-dihydroxy-6-naphthoate synthase